MSALLTLAERYDHDDYKKADAGAVVFVFKEANNKAAP